MLRIGAFSIYQLLIDRFKLDGGAMFGSVPKVLWNKLTPADEANRISLACRILILEGLNERILIDLGIGQKWLQKERNIFAIEHTSTSSKTKPLHLQIPEVTKIILTHLHFDHAGGISYLDDQGKITLSYPNATVYVSKNNWERAQSPGVRERASYLTNNIEPLKQANLVLTEEAQEILPGLKLFQAHGHTQGLQWPLITDGKRTMVYPADLIPTAHHISVPYVMGYDLCAERSMKEKEAFLEQAVTNEWIVVFEHDLETPAATILKDEKGRFTIGKTIEIPSYDAEADPSKTMIN